MKNISRYRPVFIVLFGIVLIVATFFRVYNLSFAPPGLYPDEAMNGSNALEAIATGEYKLFYPENNGREGLFINIQAMFLKAFGIQEPWALRSASAVFGILTVLGVFLLILQLYRVTKGFGLSEDKRSLAGLIAAFSGSFLMAISFWHINFSRIGFRAIMAPFFIVWAMWLLLKGFEKADEDQIKTSAWGSPASVLLMLLSGVVFGLGMHSYIAYRALPVFVLFVFALYGILFFIPFRKMIARLFLFVVGALISMAPLIQYFIKNPEDFFGRTAQISVFSSQTPLLDFALNIGKSLLMFFWFGDANWRHHYAGTGQLYPLVALLFVAGIVFGLVHLFRHLRVCIRNGLGDVSCNEAFIFLVPAGLFVVALLPTIVSNEGIPHALRAIIMIPAVFAIVGIGSAYAYEIVSKKFSSKWAMGIGVALFVFLTIQSYHMYFVDWAHRQEVKDSFAQNYVDLGHELAVLGNNVPKYVVVQAGGVDVRGLPMSTQTVMFLTDSFTPEKQKEKNIHYILPQDVSKIPEGARVFYLR